MVGLDQTNLGLEVEVLLKFRSVDYEGSKQVVASDEIKQQILKTGIRKLECETWVSRHTLRRILKGNGIRKTLAKILKHVLTAGN